MVLNYAPQGRLKLLQGDFRYISPTKLQRKSIHFCCRLFPSTGYQTQGKSSVTSPSTPPTLSSALSQATSATLRRTRRLSISFVTVFPEEEGALEDVPVLKGKPHEVRDPKWSFGSTAELLTCHALKTPAHWHNYIMEGPSGTRHILYAFPM